MRCVHSTSESVRYMIAQGPKGICVRHIAVVGSGPAGYYTAEAAQKAFGDDVRIDIIDRLPVPYGLIRSGVAPDHQSIKGVSRRFEGISLAPNTRFVGNVLVGQDVSVDELRDLYDAVVLATGAPRDRPLDLPGAELAGVQRPQRFRRFVAAARQP
jgi:ferredoxin/flavodoxin---NADP+ reductase